MKRIPILAAILLTITSAIAATSVVTIRSSDNSAISVVLNGQQLLQTGAVVKMENVRPGNNTIEVFRVNMHRGYQQRVKVYQGFIQVQPMTETFVTIVPFKNYLRIDEVVSIRPRGGNGWANNTSFDNSHSPVYTTPIYLPIDPMSFNQLKQTIANGSFESTKLNIFKQALVMNFFTTSQIAEVMNLFSFESYKVEVAKLGYSKTLDPQNYYMVNDQFNFSSSVNELSRFTASR